ncbi:unnamed protein product [Diamesa hyperborea]
MRSDDDNKISSFRLGLPQILAVCVKNMVLLAFGMSLGFPTIVIGGNGDETDLILSKTQVSWFSSINLICVPLGCIFSGSFTSYLGRRKAMQIVNIPIFASWLLFHYATSITHLYIALCLAGAAGGMMEAPVLTYVAEITTPSLRGLLSATGSTCIILGIFSQFVLGTFLKWRTIALISSFVPILAIILLFFVPESPHWLILKKRFGDAKNSLMWLRGWTKNFDNVRDEYDALYAVLVKPSVPGIESDTPTCGDKLKPYQRRSFLFPYFLCSLSFFIGHFSGMTTLQTFAVQIFATLKAPIDKYYATMILGTLELAGSIICVILVRFVGKRPLAMVSTLGYDNEIQHNEYSWIPLTLLLGSAILSHCGIRLLPWILVGEVFPAEVRSVASGLSGGLGYIFGFLANKLFLTMIETMTLPGTFWFYSSISIVGCLILYLILPETEGRTLIEIEDHFNGTKKLPKTMPTKEQQASRGFDNAAFETSNGTYNTKL